MNRILDWEHYLRTAADVAAEGIVMLRNENGALPLRKDETVSVFGRIQLHYYKSGTGSGGMVNVAKVTGITDGLIEAGVKVNEELLGIYREWDEANPIELGKGWGDEPWSQEEMPLDDETVANAAAKGETAIVIIGRTAGEEMESRVEAGSFLLTDKEKDMLAKVRAGFKKVVVLLNVGGLIDLEYIESTAPDALLYVWQGGMTGGTGCADVLTGRISPCGKLPDTIAYSVEDYPSHKYFGDRERNCYAEDIYVGYRYFDTFAPKKVRYPFGFGLSYTTFDVSVQTCDVSGLTASIYVKVRNTGKYNGKEVVMMYLSRPQGELGQPVKTLCAFEKTRDLAPNEEQTLILTADLSDNASYDDSGATGNKSCFVLEKGRYSFFIGGCDSEASANIELHETAVVRRCEQALAPVEAFERFRPVPDGDGFKVGFEAVPLSEVDEDARRLAGLPAELGFTGDRGIRLADVYRGGHTMDEFIAQLTDNELACIIRGEGMGSPRVTAGTASAFGGVTDRLNELGIPAACCSDGPSGMRLDCGTKAFSLPNGTMIASTFNKELATELFRCMGMEMTANKVDCLLGPGMNIHRHPLNGRNFEYFSEDPYLTGAMAAAELRGLHESGAEGTIKHFCGNNQETNRHFLDSVVSERALREIYLKGFEIAVKQGGGRSIMTTYGKVNGLWTAGNYDLNTTILRGDWGFTGFTMTDWWAKINRRGTDHDDSDFAAMAKAQNDVYMVCADGDENPDNTLASLASGDLTRGELQRNAANICRFILTTNAFRRTIGEADTVTIEWRPAEEQSSDEPVIFYDLTDGLSIDLSSVKSVKGTNHSFALTVIEPGWYEVSVTASSQQSELAQIPLTIFAMGTASGTLTWNGTGGALVTHSTKIPMFSRFTTMRLYFAQSGLDLISIDFRKAGDLSELTDIAVKED
ncbi:MAG: glycoside hydrolase family 3 C-terminal domain-containing protein [Ruminococcus sp.]|nr:glycoside hydrolase family 3 C-terminal domain-containing protein [Ruminococcus sp.]